MRAFIDVCTYVSDIWIYVHTYIYIYIYIYTHICYVLLSDIQFIKVDYLNDCVGYLFKVNMYIVKRLPLVRNSVVADLKILWQFDCFLNFGYFPKISEI